MDERMRQQFVSKIKMMANYDFENLVSEENSLGVGLRNFLPPAEQTSSNRSTYSTNGEGSQKNTEERQNWKEEPLTPRSRKNSLSFGRSNCYERENETIGDRYSCQTTSSPMGPGESSINCKESNLNTNEAFKVRCDLRISIPNDQNALFASRQVYTLDCDEDCKKFAKSSENPCGKFENCYESSSVNRFSTNFIDDDHFEETCKLRVSVSMAQSPYGNRYVHLVHCSGNCGKFCENHEPHEMPENYAEYTDINQSFWY